MKENIDELIYKREMAQQQKQWAVADEIRNYLDTQLVFIIDHSWGQQGYYLTDKYFDKKPDNITHRKYLEQRIKKDQQAEKNFNGWLYTTRKAGTKK